MFFFKVMKVGPNEVKQGANKKWNLSENIAKNIFDYTTMLFIKRIWLERGFNRKPMEGSLHRILLTWGRKPHEKICKKGSFGTIASFESPEIGKSLPRKRAWWSWLERDRPLEEDWSMGAGKPVLCPCDPVIFFQIGHLLFVGILTGIRDDRVQTELFILLFWLIFNIIFTVLIVLVV